jgi:hypothetical protein
MAGDLVLGSLSDRSQLTDGKARASGGASSSFPDHSFDATDFAAGGRACNPRIRGIGADGEHHEHRSPSTRMATDASG